MQNGLTVDTNGFDVTIPKLLATDVTSLGGGLTKTGSGILTLTSANTYTGDTNIKQGDLRINVNHSSATGNVIVGDDEGDFGSAILSGNGIVGGPITLNIDGAIAPGNGLGVLITGFNVSGEGELTMQLDGAVADTLELTGSGVIDISELNLNLSVISDPTQTSYILVESASAITGSAFASVSGLPAGYAVVYDNTLHQIRIEGTPPAAGYDAFADSITDVTKRGELDDADSDGISNLIEYALAGNPNLPNRQILPAFAATATNAVFTFKRSDDSENDTTQIFQWSTDLQTWNDVALGAATAGIVSVVENESAADDITVTITKGTNTKIFGRVKIDKP
jgi:autotransporter-associated beta strand protein